MPRSTRRLPSHPQSASFFEKISNTIPAMIVMYDITTGEYLFVNDVCRTVLGYTKKEILEGGLSFVNSLVHPDDFPAIQKQNEVALRQANSPRRPKDFDQRIFKFEYRMKDKKGKYHWLNTYGSIFSRDKKGKVKCVINVSTDVTKNKENEKLLSNIEQKVEVWNIIEHMNDAVIALDAKGNYLYANEKAAQLANKKKKEFSGQNIWKLFPELKKYPIYSQFRKVLVEKKALVGEYLSPVSKKWVRLHMYPSGSGVSIFFTDITDRRNAEESLKRSEDRLTLALDASQMGIWDWDIEKNTIVWSEQLERLFDLQPGTFNGTFEAYQQLLYPDDREALQHVLQEALETGKEYVIEYRVVWRDGSIHWLLGMGKALFDPKTKKPVRMTGTARNIDDLKRIEQRKDDFVSMASHELKTPITSLKIFTQLLRRQFQKKGNETSLHYLEKMDEQINKLTRLIRELLDVSRISSGKLKIAPAPFDLCECSKEIIEYFKETTKQRIVFKGLKECTVFADRDRISQVIINLFTNAIKYSPPESSIFITLSKKKNDIIFSVKDSGVGIPKEHHQRIFERFYQVTPTADASVSGLGMGLYICKQIITLHGGKIWLESDVGKGSTFSFSLPISTGV